MLGKRTMVAGGLSPLADLKSRAGSPAPVFNFVYLAVAPGTGNSIEAAPYHLPGATSVQFKSAIDSDWRSLLGFFNVFIGVILAFALVMSFALLFNAMTVNVLEQKREFATMRSLGVGRLRIASLMATETVIVWLLALVPGLLLGRWMALWLATSYQSDLLNFRIYVSASSYILTAAGIIITMLLAALPAIRRVNRLNLGEATKVFQ